MSKILVLFTFLSIGFFNFYSNDSASKEIFATVTPTTTPTPNAPNNSYKVELDRDEFVAPCPPGYRCRQSNDYSAPLVVTVLNANKKHNPIRYKYTVSGGRIVGNGAKVNWDLTGAMPGTYNITVIFEDKLGNEIQRITKTVSVFSFQDDGDRCLAACPELFVGAPISPIQAGETMTFTANASGGFDVENLTYEWTVSNGKIIEGQGTPVIRVETNLKMAGKTIEATANYKWDSDCWEICNKTASASGLVTAKKRESK